jgi:hypothetical protein
MINLINSIVSKDYVNADSIINEKVESIMKKKFEEAKKMCAAKIEEEPHTMNRSSSELTRLGVVEEENLEEARINIVKARVRGGKIQRRKKVSNVPGMTMRGGKLQRMSASERRRRKIGAKRAVRKRAPKLNRALIKRKRSLMKRRSLGI